MPGWMGLSDSVCPQGAGLLLFPDLPSQATGPNSASPGKRQEQSGEFTGPGMFITYGILQTLYLCGFVLWLLALLPPLVRKRSCILPLLVPRLCSACAWCTTAFGDFTAFQEHPLTAATLGLAWHLVSLHFFLTQLLISPAPASGGNPTG